MLNKVSLFGYQKLHPLLVALFLLFATSLAYSAPPHTSAHRPSNTGSFQIKLMARPLSAPEYVADSIALDFDYSFSNAIDNNDKLKNFGPGEQLAIKRNNQFLRYEQRRVITEADSIPLQLTNTVAGNYRFDINCSEMQNLFLQAFLQDKYLQQETPISFTNNVSIAFSVNGDAASKAPDRFLIFFRARVVTGPLPVTFINMQATAGEKNTNNINWKVAIELSLHHYETEKSTDGVAFTKFGNNVFSTGNGNAASYTQQDVMATTVPILFYRIKAVSTTGQFTYSNITKLQASNSAGSITIYPNPAIGSSIQLHFNDMPGKYQYAIVNINGQTVATGNFTVGRMLLHKTIVTNTRMPRGRYEIILINDIGRREAMALIVR